MTFLRKFLCCYWVRYIFAINIFLTTHLPHQINVIFECPQRQTHKYMYDTCRCKHMHVLRICRIKNEIPNFSYFSTLLTLCMYTTESFFRFHVCLSLLLLCYSRGFFSGSWVQGHTGLLHLCILRWTVMRPWNLSTSLTIYSNGGVKVNSHYISVPQNSNS